MQFFRAQGDFVKCVVCLSNSPKLEDIQLNTMSDTEKQQIVPFEKV